MNDIASNVLKRFLIFENLLNIIETMNNDVDKHILYENNFKANFVILRVLDYRLRPEVYTNL